MAKIESTFINMVAVLTTITLITGAGLGYVYKLTAGPIAAADKAQQIAAIEAVAPAFDNSPLDEKKEITTQDGGVITIFPAKNGDEEIGAAVETYTKNGFGGVIKIMVGFDKEGTVLNYQILKHAETPGLGSKMQEWFSTNKNKQSILGKSFTDTKFTVSKDGGDIDAITAATITSRAFLKAIQSGYDAYIGNTDGASGASDKNWQKENEEDSDDNEKISHE